MKNNKDIQDELKGIAPLLSNMDKNEEGYQVPHLYFETLQNKVMNKIAEQPAQESVLNRFLKSILQAKYALAIAGVLALLMVGTFVINPENTNNTASLASISTEELAAYLDDNIDDMELDVLLENTETTLDFSDGMNFDLDEMEDYIDNEFFDELDDTSLEDFL